MKLWDTLFYYGMKTVEEENEQDLLLLVQQPVMSMFYNRSFGCEINYNYPMSVISQALTARSIASAVAIRNQNVSDGSDGNPDRRVALSQNTVSVEDKPNGYRTITLLYFNFANMTVPTTLNVPVV
jgi:hypothetical protein